MSSYLWLMHFISFLRTRPYPSPFLDDWFVNILVISFKYTFLLEFALPHMMGDDVMREVLALRIYRF